MSNLFPRLQVVSCLRRPTSYVSTGDNRGKAPSYHDMLDTTTKKTKLYQYSKILCYVMDTKPHELNFYKHIMSVNIYIYLQKWARKPKFLYIT